ncbi:hypothetical protein C4D60_Mb10t08410 [Musa balbisiana]|uniref:Uncharacterized protein n=1 Tax=Musa balbisiana TaxID=52838 RepID=A0A4S8IVP2_MUSBA|nr:hypothetical protein C4D60_Mb10t08410 [Musa balbisiana]
MMWISALHFDILGALNAVTNLPASRGTAACYRLKDLCSTDLYTPRKTSHPSDRMGEKFRLNTRAFFASRLCF